MNDVKIIYGNIDPLAKECFSASSSNAEYNTLQQLSEYNLIFPKYTNPCEYYQTLLDGTGEAVPPEKDTPLVAFWSNEISDKDGLFNKPVVLTLVSDKKHSSPGLVLKFDEYNAIYATSFNIAWYEDDVEISSVNYEATEVIHNCINRVDFYNKIIITFYSINVPYNRLKLASIDYGFGITFANNNLKNVKLIQEINPLSSEITINTTDFTLDLNSNEEFNFQKRQPILTYLNGILKSTTFIRNFKRKSKTLWNFQTDDYIGLLNNIPFAGGLFSKKNAVELLEKIAEVSKIPFEISEDLQEKTVTGYIPYTNCREALMQIAFAIGAVVDTSNSDKVKVFSLGEEIKQSIPLGRIMQGQRFDDDEEVTGIELAWHSYVPIEEEVELYNSQDSGISPWIDDDYQPILIKFNEPIHNMSWEGIMATRIDYGDNYAVFLVEHNDFVLKGKRYKHTSSTFRKNNPQLLASETENIISIQDATLISNENVIETINRCYNYLVDRRTVNMKVIDLNDTMNAGDKVEVETQYLGNKEGRIIKQSFNLNSGMLVKDMIVK